MQLIKGINVVSISVTDLNQARDFYSNKLGLGKPLFDIPEAGWIEFETGAPYGNIALALNENKLKPNHSTTIVFNTDDCFESYKELKRRGISCDKPEVFPGYVTFFSFYDPFGNRLQMCSDAPDTDKNAR